MRVPRTARGVVRTSVPVDVEANQILVWDHGGDPPAEPSADVVLSPGKADVADAGDGSADRVGIVVRAQLDAVGHVRCCGWQQREQLGISQWRGHSTSSLLVCKALGRGGHAQGLVRPLGVVV